MQETQLIDALCQAVLRESVNPEFNDLSTRQCDRRGCNVDGNVGAGIIEKPLMRIIINDDGQQPVLK